MHETFAALAEPSRLRIVEFLCSGARPVGEIATALNLNQPQASKHLAILRSARLVNVEKRAQQRLYTIRPDAMRELSLWLERYRRVWDARFDELDILVEGLKRKEKLDG
ncbi:MAG: metalloregulator ArsR/SmtB family transcription factor [Sphingomicrobium sp.]